MYKNRASAGNSSAIRAMLFLLKPATHLAIFFADRGDVAVSKSHCDKIAQPHGLTLLAIRSDERRKSRERAHLANAGEFNRRYLTCQISAILYADRGDRRKSQSPHRAHLAIFADRRDRRIKSPSVSLALGNFPAILHLAKF